MLTRRAALAVARLFRFFDATCRHDLATRRIISERDYVSNLATHIRYPYGAFCAGHLVGYGRLLNKVWPLPGPSPRFLSVTSAPNVEQRYGCDGILIFSFDLGDGNFLHRIGMYKAKWPRLDEASGAILTGWDDGAWRPTSRQRKPVPPCVYKSRFTNELLLQQPVAEAGIVVWEQFFCQLPVPQYTDDFRRYGSTCVLHKPALAYARANPELLPSAEAKKPARATAPVGHRAWQGNDLSQLLQGDSLSFGYLIYQMLRPKGLGQNLLAFNNYVTVPNVRATRPRAQPEDFTDELAIPIFTSAAAAADYPLAITRFLRENGLNSYIHVTFDAGTLLAAKFELLREQLSRDGRTS